MEQRCKIRFGVYFLLGISVLLVAGIFCVYQNVRFKSQQALQCLRIRSFVCSMQDTVEELIELNAVEDLRNFNREVGKSLLDASQDISTKEFWDKWNRRLLDIKSSVK